MMDDELPETVKKCLDILEENVEILADIEIDFKNEKEDELTPNMKLYQLFDMTEDVSEFSKLKRAEFNFMRRQSDDFL